MSEALTPPKAAKALGISINTLRKWAREFAPFLSASAQGGPTARRAYQDADMLVLRDARMLLASGATYDKVRERLRHRDTNNSTEAPQRAAETATAAFAEVMVIEASDQAEVLAEARWQLVKAQEQHIVQLRENIAQLVQQLDQAREHAEADRAGLLSQLDQARLIVEAERVQWAAALERARSDEAAALAELRRVLGKIPRWLRALLGLGV